MANHPKLEPKSPTPIESFDVERDRSRGPSEPAGKYDPTKRGSRPLQGVGGAAKTGDHKQRRSTATLIPEDKRALIDERLTEVKSRDDLTAAFAGRENRGPAAKPKKDFRGSTHVRNRNQGPKD